MRLAFTVLGIGVFLTAQLGAQAATPRSPRRASIQVLPDGRVFADLGHGYEQVIQSCGAPAPLGVPATAISSAAGPATTPPPATDPLPFGVTRPNSAQLPFGVTQPVPNTPPPVAPVTTASVGGTSATQSCWSTDSRGQILIVHP